MKQRNLLKKLSEVEASNSPFISVYLNTQPNEHGRDDFNVFLKKQLSEHQAEFEEDSTERESFDRDVEKIKEFAEKIKPSANGVAIFACDGANGFFKTIQFDVPFEKDRFYVFDRPHIYPLARLIDQNPRYAVVLADTNSAHIYVIQRGRIIDEEDIKNEITNRSEVGGWSQARYQRHVDEVHKKHAKEVIENLQNIVREDDIRQIILAGNEEVVIPILRDELTDELESKLVGTVRADVNAPKDELWEKVEQAVHQHDMLKDKEKIDYFNEQNYDDGFCVGGAEKTLQALENGQVQELYLTAKFNEIKFNENQVKKILENYAAGDDSKMPDIKEGRQIADELIRLALQSAERVRFIEDENLLEEVGGVGALLRYKMSANQKI